MRSFLVRGLPWLNMYHAVHGYGINVMGTAVAEHRKVTLPCSVGTFWSIYMVIPVSAYILFLLIFPSLFLFFPILFLTNKKEGQRTPRPSPLYHDYAIK